MVGVVAACEEKVDDVGSSGRMVVGGCGGNEIGDSIGCSVVTEGRGLCLGDGGVGDGRGDVVGVVTW